MSPFVSTFGGAAASGYGYSRGGGGAPAPGIPFTLDYLVVAGGGGGGTSGANYCGGGGAGGYRTTTGTTGGGGAAEAALTIIPNTTYTVTVGAGGSAEANGANSVFATVTSDGGGAGRGNAFASPGFAGGSGGGGTPVNGIGGARSTNPIQGNIGGVASSANQGGSDSGAGGGGGAGGQGNDLTSPGGFRNSPGQGGAGLQNSITGTNLWYAAGGNGSAFYFSDSQNGIGGATGGLNFPQFQFQARDPNGVANTGSGAGGGRSSVGGSGGSGAVIIRYPTTATITGGAGLTFTTSVVNGLNVTRFTAGTGTISFTGGGGAPIVPTLPVAGATFWADATDFSGSTWTSRVGGLTASVISGTATVVPGNGNGATATFNAIQGNTGTLITFSAGVLPSTYTLFHVTRYTGGNSRRIYTSSSGSGVNWLSGHWNGFSGVAFHEGWLTQSSSSIHGNNWVISTDQNSLYRSNGVTRGSSGGSASAALTINGWSSETSDFQTAEIIVYNRTLSVAEYGSIETYLSSKYGIAI